MNLNKVFRHRYTGYFLNGLTVLLLFSAVVHVGDRVYTLESEGCKAYYSKFAGVESFEFTRFVNRSERKELLGMNKEEEKLLNNSSKTNYSSIIR